MNQTLSIHPEMQSLVRIAETGARAIWLEHLFFGGVHVE